MKPIGGYCQTNTCHSEATLWCKLELTHLNTRVRSREPASSSPDQMKQASGMFPFSSPEASGVSQALATVCGPVCVWNASPRHRVDVQCGLPRDGWCLVAALMATCRFLPQLSFSGCSHTACFWGEVEEGQKPSAHLSAKMGSLEIIQRRWSEGFT